MITDNPSNKLESPKAKDAPIVDSDQCRMDEDGKDPDHIEVVSVEVMNLENDNSVASADNEVPDIQDAPQQDLNFLA